MVCCCIHSKNYDILLTRASPRDHYVEHENGLFHFDSRIIVIFLLNLLSSSLSLSGGKFRVLCFCTACMGMSR